jgi:glycosyltransferase involved in cell wall biosynthesis
MRIVYLSPSGNLGGAEICLLDMLAVLRDTPEQFQLFVILGEDGPLKDRARSLGAEVIVLPFPKGIARLGDSGSSNSAFQAFRLLSALPTFVSYRQRLRDQLNRICPDVVHSNGLKMHLLGALTKSSTTKLVWHIHDYVSLRPMMVRLMRRLSGRVDLLIANSKSVAQDLQVLKSQARIIAVLNVVDLDEFAPEGPCLDLDQLSELPPAPPETIRVGLLATMAWWKGHRLFLDAISKLDPQTSVRGYVIGGPVYQTNSHQESLEELRKYAASTGISHRVGFTGFVSDPAKAIRALDVVVHASTQPEPFGRIIVEAMACAKPVVTTGMGGANEIVETADFSCRFDGTASSLAQQLKKLVSDSEERKRLGINGLGSARVNFQRQRLARQLRSVYVEACTRVS